MLTFYMLEGNDGSRPETRTSGVSEFEGWVSTGLTENRCLITQSFHEATGLNLKDPVMNNATCVISGVEFTTIS